MEAHSSSAVPSLSYLSIIQRLRAAFGRLPDTPQRGKVLHPLDEVMLCAFCSILCDGESYTDMEDFAETQLPWLRGFLTLEHGAPSHDVRKWGQGANLDRITLQASASQVCLRSPRISGGSLGNGVRNGVRVQILTESPFMPPRPKSA